MLADERAEALVQNFAGQWLYLRNRAEDPGPIRISSPSSTPILRNSFETGERAVLPEHHLGRPERARSHQRGLHVPQRAPGAPLRHPERVWQPFPARRAQRREPEGLPRPGQHPDRHVLRHADSAIDPRQVAAGEHPRHAATAAAAKRSRPRAERRRRQADDDAAADGRASRQSGLRQLPQIHGPARLRARELRRDRQVAHDGWRRHDRCVRRHARWFPAEGTGGFARLPDVPPRSVRHHADRETSDLCAWPRRRGVRPSRDPQDRAGNRNRTITGGRRSCSRS